MSTSSINDPMIDDEVPIENVLANGSVASLINSSGSNSVNDNGSTSASSSSTNKRTQQSTEGKYMIEDDDQQDGGEFPSLKDDDVSNETRIDELLNNASVDEQHNIILNYLQKGVYYPFVAQWRNPVVSAIKENVIVKSAVQFNPYFGCVFVVEPLFDFEDSGNSSDTEDYASSKRKKKAKKTHVTDLTSTGYYAMAADLFGLKKKSVIGRILDDHRKFIKRCVLVNYIKCFNEANYLEICRHECESRIPNLSTITEQFPNSIRLKSSDDEVLKRIVDVYQSHGGRPPQKLNKKIDVNAVSSIDDINKRLSYMCPESSGAINDLPNLVRYVTTSCIFPFEVKITTRYSFLFEQQIQFTLNITSVNYRCKQGVILKGNVVSGQIEPIDVKYMVRSEDDDTDEDYNERRIRKKRRLPGNTAVTPYNTYNGKEVKVSASKLILSGDSINEHNQKVLNDYQVWFCHSVLLDEKKLDDQWNNLRYFLQFIN
jgi:hypothetical protein